MSIEDIDFLYENSVKDNFILYCDSALRNKNFHPHPNAYTVSFNQPFRYVFGLDVLDASIPATMYNIESTANQVSGFTYTLNPQSTSAGYTFQSLFTELSNFDVFDTVLNSSTIVTILPGGAISFETGIVFVTTFDLMQSYLNNVATVSNPTPAITDYEQVGAGYFVFQRGIVANAVIFNAADLYEFDSPVYEFVYDGVTYQIINDPQNATYQNLISIVETYGTIVQPNQDNTYNLVYYQWTEVPKSLIITLRIQNSLMYLLDMSFLHVTVSAGNYDVTSFLLTCQNAAFGATPINVTSVNPQNPAVIPKMLFSSNVAFVLNMDRSSARTSMGFDEYADPLETVEYVQYSYRNNNSLFGSVYNPNSGNWQLTAPGVIYLLGSRYIILRCPEIEGHMHGSRAFGDWSPGIGMFKLYAVNDVAHQRFDFVNFSKKPFHPIGKLSQLSFRFELPDGTLYDFKAANHLMLLSIKYFVPSQKRRFTYSPLAPNYHYDFHSYLARHIEAKERSDDEEDIDISDLKNKFVQQEKKYDYPSSDSESDSQHGGNEPNYGVTAAEYGRLIRN